MNRRARRISYVFLCTLPFLDLAVLGTRALRVAGVYQIIGGVLFASIAIAAWILGAPAIGSSAAATRKLALAGVLLIVPWAIMSILWVGIGAPFQATRPENYMRFLVLVANSIIVAGACVILKDALYDGGERFYSTVGFAAGVPAGAAYLVSNSMSVAATVSMIHGAAPPQAVLGDLFSVLEFVACALTYVTTAAFATSLSQARWLGRGAARAYVTASSVLLLLLVLRGLSFPEISSDTAPWYTRPGVIAGIPAIPWVMLCLLGVVSLRRAGNSQPIESPRSE
jgi:hypothetical protein